MKIRLLFDIQIAPHLATLKAGEVFEAVRVYNGDRRRPGVEPSIGFDATRVHPDLREVLARTGEYTTDLNTPLAALASRTCVRSSRTVIASGSPCPRGRTAAK